VSALCPMPWHDERLATAGEICQTCADGIGIDARDAVLIYDELALVHAPTKQGYAEQVTTSPERRIPYSDKAGDWRVVIQRTLERWALVITRERALRRPMLTLWDVAEVIERNSGWLARSIHARAAAVELRDIARGEARNIAYLDKAAMPGHVERVITCPVVRCGAPMRAILRREAALRASEVICTANSAHAWDSGRWLDLNPSADARISTAEAAIVVWGDDTTQSRDCIRQYVSRGKLTRGDDRMFSLAEVGALARSMWSVTAS
jgi:hypothetical protein